MTRLRVLLVAAAVGVALTGRHVLPVVHAGVESLTGSATAVAVAPPRDTVTALGRIAPRGGVIRVAGPSRPSVVVAELLIDDGAAVSAGQPIAILDRYAAHSATVAQIEAELRNAEAERRRHATLLGDGYASRSEVDAWRTKAEALRAQLARARAERDLAIVRAPLSGRVLEVHAREGERVGADGIAELGETQVMTAVAEVYATDVSRVRVGQRATVSSPALAAPLEGSVDRVGLKIASTGVRSLDPAARTDARVVAVRVVLDDAAPVAGLTNLEVDVAIAP